MQTTVNKQEFCAELEWVARFIEKKTSIPILQNVRIQKTGSTLLLTGTDLEIGGITSVQAAGGDDFTITVTVDTLKKYLKKVDDHTLRLKPPARPVLSAHGILSDLIKTAKYPWVRRKLESAMQYLGKPEKTEPVDTACRLILEHGDDSKVVIDGMSADSYPELPARPEPFIALRGLTQAIQRTSVSISTEESRFTLNGGLLEIRGDDAKLISTDGHRLSIVPVGVACAPALTSEGEPVKYRMLIPKRGLTEVARFADAAEISLDENHIWFAHGRRTVIARKLTGNFPDWERFVPKNHRYSVVVPVQQLKKVIDRVAVFADKRSRAIRLGINGALSISSSLSDTGSASGQVPYIGPEFVSEYASGFNADYLTDFLNAAKTETAQFTFEDPRQAAALEIPGWKYVVMPMRLDEDVKPAVVAGEYSAVPNAEPYTADELRQAGGVPKCSECGIPTRNEGGLCNLCAEPAPAVEVVVAERPAAPPRQPEPMPDGVIDRLRYGSKQHDSIELRVFADTGGFHVSGIYNLAGYSGGELGDGGYQVSHATRDEAMTAFLRTALQPSRGPWLDAIKRDNAAVRERAKRMVEWLVGQMPGAPSLDRQRASSGAEQKVRSVKPKAEVSPDRSAAARKAWVTIRAKRATAAEAA